MDFLEPWHATNSQTSVDELKREVAPGHLLYGIPLSTIARRQDQDEVLFQLHDGTGRVAEVHLSWKRAQESDPRWPAVRLFSSFEAWAVSMKSDHDDFVS
jgi:hypothetical protein